MVTFSLPRAMDGGPHLISDIAGIGPGFRDSTAWLAGLTGNSIPSMSPTPALRSNAQ